MNFIKLFKNIGLKNSDVPIKLIKINNTVKIEDGNKFISIEKSNTTLEIEFEINYENQIIKNQKPDVEIRKKEFSNFKNDFLNKNLNNQIIKEMWNLINSQNISKIIILNVFYGVESALKKNLKIISIKELLVYSYRLHV